MKTLLACMAGLATLPMVAHADSPYFSLQDGDGFKRFSVSVGALHVMPQGKAQPFKVNTAVKEGETSQVGDISIDSVKIILIQTWIQTFPLFLLIFWIDLVQKHCLQRSVGELKFMDWKAGIILVLAWKRMMSPL